MFADHTKVFRIIKRHANRKPLQDDLDKLSLWSSKWLLHIQPEMETCASSIMTVIRRSFSRSKAMHFTSLYKTLVMRHSSMFPVTGRLS